MKENTRRELLKRLTVIAVASGGAYIAPKATVLANHKCGHQQAPPCSP